MNSLQNEIKQKNNSPEKRLNKIYAGVVPSQEQFEMRVYSDLEMTKQKKSIFTPNDYTVYLVNESNLPLDTLEINTGGFDGSGDVLVEMKPFNKSYSGIKPGGYVQIESLDFGMLDFVLWYKLKLKFSDGVALASEFSINKAYALRKDIFQYCAALKTKGYKFQLSEI